MFKDIVVIGTGFSGIGVATKLIESGRTDFVILEKAHEVGGTWRDNTYPGCECDVPSHMYSYSWRLNPDWSKHFSPQPEIWSYVRKVADEKGIRPYIHFGVEVTGLEWDELRSVWTIRTTSGEDYEARVVVSGVGGIHVPNVPLIKGAETFAGPRFHSAEWDHSVDLTGKKVAVIGTGASAIQFVPIIAEEAQHLTVFQRTPPWVLPKKDAPIHPNRRRIFHRLPVLARGYRNALYWALESRAIAFNGHVDFLPIAQRWAAANIERAIDDPEMVRRLTPDYKLGCKRILQSNTYYPTFNRDNVDLVSEHITEIVPDGVIDADGVKHEADVIIYGTGFHTVDAFDFIDIRGRDGLVVADQFREHGVETYLGIAVHQVPNLFLMLGPNTLLGHNSVVFMIEQQTKFIMAMLDAMDARGARAVEVTKRAQDDWNEEIQRLVSKGIWTKGGCTSWYLDKQGKNRSIWPKFTFQYWWETRKVVPEHFTWTSAARVAAAR